MQQHTLEERWYQKRWVIGMIALAFGAGAGFFISSSSSSSSLGEVHAGVGVFTNPLLECEFGEEYISKGFTRPFKAKLDAFAQDEFLSSGKAKSISVYFRNLNNGAWFGINESENFIPASLLKVPMLFTVLKEAEKNPAVLKQELVYEKGDAGAPQYFKPSDPIQLGKTYTIEELAARMITQSDNNAALMLVMYFGNDKIAKVYTDLGIDAPNNDLVGSMNVKRYASFFRVLFNASYLTREFSEAALALLSKTEFQNGLNAGVPLNISIAHKFGEHTGASGDYGQLHDCGIVYYPKRPYLLCVMTKGTNPDALAGAIRDISRFVYDEVKAQADAGGGY